MNTERTRIDVSAIKQEIDLVAVARGYTALRKISRTGEHAGPCPLCGGMDRFHVKDARFYCRQCYPRGGDVIDLVMLVENLPFQDACRVLTDNSSLLEKQEQIMTPRQAHREPSSDWTEKQFQTSAQRTIRATHHLLSTEQGRAGQDYLHSRGLTPATWQTYNLGYGQTYHPVRHEQQAAIFIPWFTADGTQITAIQHRFIDPSFAKNERYSMKAGSSPIIFGLQALTLAETLVIVEGEFNCMAIHQVGYQAVSVGSESNRSAGQRLELLCDVVEAYPQVLVWFDNPAYGQQLAVQLTVNASVGKRMNVVDGIESDANELLLEGDLPDILDMANYQSH